MYNNSELNSTGGLQVPVLFEKSWLFAQIFNFIYLFGTLWTCITIIIYGLKKKKWKIKNKKEKKSSVLLALAALCPFFLVFRLAVTEALIIIDLTHKEGLQGNRMCETAFDLSVVLFSFRSFPVYTFFWYRQKTLYLQPSLRNIHTKTVKSFSNLFAVLLFLGGGSSCFIKTIPVSYEMSPYGCIQRPDESENNLANYITAATLVASQATLFAL